MLLDMNQLVLELVLPLGHQRAMALPTLLFALPVLPSWNDAICFYAPCSALGLWLLCYDFQSSHRRTQSWIGSTKGTIGAGFAFTSAIGGNVSRSA
uniref:Uncharacterized protein n=1 Tax=Picea glauca TaxID=3330 RepID=A0A101LYQ9_PICGL|nr:hypothetical protein ABT39_MTgene5840 [Picea glauca]QHR92323.1 hypothetical protein Q903MT_gene6365 [Picea sitchensis]